MLSKSADRLVLLLIDKNDSRQLDMNKNMERAVHSSMNDRSLSFSAFKEMNTTKHNPKRFEEVFRMWGDLLSFDIF